MDNLISIIKLDYPCQKLAQNLGHSFFRATKALLRQEQQKPSSCAGQGKHSQHQKQRL